MSQFIPVEIYQRNNNYIAYINSNIITYIREYSYESCLELALDYNKLSGTTIPRKAIVCKDKNEEAYNMLINNINLNDIKK